MLVDDKVIVYNDQVEPTDDGVNFDVNETERKVVELMLENPQIKTQEIADKLGYTKHNVWY